MAHAGVRNSLDLQEPQDEPLTRIDGSASGGRGTRWVLAGLGLALAAALVTGCSQTSSTAGSGATATPSQSVQQPTPTAASAPVPYDPTAPFAAAMQKYADMDIQTFEKLPRDERLRYAQYLIDRKAGDYDTYYGDGDANAIQPTPVSTKNSGQQIVESNLYHVQLAFMQDGTSDAQKTLSSAFYNVEWPHGVADAYSAYKDFAATNAPTGLDYTRTAKKTETIKTGRDVDTRVQRQYKVVTYYDSSHPGTSYARFVLYPFTSYDGSKKAIWLMDGQTYVSRTLLYAAGALY